MKTLNLHRHILLSTKSSLSKNNAFIWSTNRSNGVLSRGGSLRMGAYLKIHLKRLSLFWDLLPQQWLNQNDRKLKSFVIFNTCTNSLPTTPLPINEDRLKGSPLLYSTSLSIAFSMALDNALFSKLPQELKFTGQRICYSSVSFFLSNLPHPALSGMPDLCHNKHPPPGEHLVMNNSITWTQRCQFFSHFPTLPMRHHF